MVKVFGDFFFVVFFWGGGFKGKLFFLNKYFLKIVDLYWTELSQQKILILKKTLEILMELFATNTLLKVVSLLLEHFLTKNKKFRKFYFGYL